MPSRRSLGPTRPRADPVELLVRRPAWHSDANCRGQLELMYDGPEYAALAVCDGCEVRSECLAAALARKEPDGVWGGFTAAERAQIIATPSEEIPGLLRHFATLRSSTQRRLGA